jgi:hypothetical protein
MPSFKLGRNFSNSSRYTNPDLTFISYSSMNTNPLYLTFTCIIGVSVSTWLLATNYTMNYSSLNYVLTFLVEINKLLSNLIAMLHDINQSGGSLNYILGSELHCSGCFRLLTHFIPLIRNMLISTMIRTILFINPALASAIRLQLNSMENNILILKELCRDLDVNMNLFTS